MNTEILGIVLMFFATLALSLPLGRYIAGVYAIEPHGSGKVFGWLERLIFRLSGIDPAQEMTWQGHLKALLSINAVWFMWAMFVLLNQGWLPLNPDRNPSMSLHLAFNTAISFLVNCNLQHYSGETGATYFSQVFALMFLQFVSAGTGLAAAAVLFNALKERTTQPLGNFYQYLVRVFYCQSRLSWRLSCFLKAHP